MTYSSQPAGQLLIQQIEQYKPTDAAEIAHRTSVLMLLKSASEPFSRYSYQPGHITGSVWIRAVDTDQIALIYHRKLNKWLQPGGHAESGEIDGVTTALREAREELGLEFDRSRAALFDLDVHQIPATSNQPSHLHFDLRYLCLTKQQPLISGSDAANARWFTFADLKAIPIDESMQRMLNKVMDKI